MEFSRQEYWSIHALPPGDLPEPGTEPTSLTSPLLAGGFFTTSTTWEVHLGIMDSLFRVLRKNNIFSMRLYIREGSYHQREV